MELPWQAQSAMDAMAVRESVQMPQNKDLILSHRSARPIKSIEQQQPMQGTDENKWELHYTDDIHRSTDNVQVSDAALTNPSQS
jgi:hypothetical protein